eukprot:7688070-Pyramimonas_sp.AAC.1
MYSKGYDASGVDDEEVFEEQEFSDDEAEMEAKRKLKASKRKGRADGEDTAANSGPSGDHLACSPMFR